MPQALPGNINVHYRGVPQHDTPRMPAETSPPPYQPVGRAGSFFRAQDLVSVRQGPNLSAAAAAAAGLRADLGEGESSRRRAAAPGLGAVSSLLRRR